MSYVLEGKKINVNGLQFHVVDEGSGPAVLLLHGFPDSSYLWRNQIQTLVKAGYRVIAPDLRGFGETDKPQEVEAYDIQLLLGDVIGILKELQVERVRLVGHDWGAVLGWALTSLFPHVVDKYVPISVGLPGGRHGLSIDQLEKSWYIFMFQSQHYAEEFLSKNNWEVLREWGRMHSEQEKWVHELSRPGALTAALNWYRANASMKSYVNTRVLPNIKVPTLGIWSSFDAYLTEAKMVQSAERIDGPWRYERFTGSHWVPLDQSEQLNKILIEFFEN
ncbi:alpha/beta fold hydrolase [Bacillus sp. JJ722]|uniref:alpha/beta fold hydrolase n=1 Tax=Bacillus sp. JJ722 TaxID=3122973 RepID=UPI002FFE4E59